MSESKSVNTKRRIQAEQSTTGEDIRLGTIIVVGFISLALFGVGIGWSYGIQSALEEQLRLKGRAHPPAQLGKLEIGIVDQNLFDTDDRLAVWTAAQNKRLSSYGWVDRAKGVAHMPIEIAIQQVMANPPDIAGEGVPPSGKIAGSRAAAGPVPSQPGPATGQVPAGQAAPGAEPAVKTGGGAP